MALSSAWCLVLPLGLLWGAAGSREAQGDDKAFPFDVEESSAVGRHDPPETSEPRVVPGRLPPTAETCGAGFFLAHSGECLPCDCNGNANECMDGSGLCVNCQRNTTGEHCEKCLDGYIGDSIRGPPQLCQPCPCPLPQLANFAESCYRKNGAVRCICKENYAGPNCERCAPGYYGNPLLIGSTCKKCDCSGNSDPNLIFEDCDEVTGQCRNCLRNTTGFKCERCAPGYYGDARIAKNCAVCNCGGGPCDSVTGECLEEGFEAPTGMDCPTISCDKCIWDLTDDLRLAALSIEESKSGLLSVSSGAAAHRHVNEMNSTIYLLKTKLSERENQYVLRKIQINNAENTMKSLLSDLDELAERVHYSPGWCSSVD
ncbi:laminin subunit alpha 4 [Phyllostomus discolor]|uniref:Laminin subunit alpha-4 n=1 Tax=Phyllostomus discolor TaxID=89673 RepID=A0A834EHC2_9CHIR|nr:laminin subunit alpha 4 [Phyllostomus discolor]